MTSSQHIPADAAHGDEHDLRNYPDNVVRHSECGGPVLGGAVGEPHRCDRCGGALTGGTRPDFGHHWEKRNGWLTVVETPDDGLQGPEALWQDLADALNAFEDAGVSVGFGDLSGPSDWRHTPYAHAQNEARGAGVVWSHMEKCWVVPDG